MAPARRAPLTLALALFTACTRSPSGSAQPQPSAAPAAPSVATEDHALSAQAAGHLAGLFQCTGTATTVAEALVRLPAWAALRIVAWEGGGEALHAVLARFAKEEEMKAAQGRSARAGCAVLVGPEGGLDAREVALARTHGFVPVGLGPRVLRTETVAAALLAVLSYALGDLRAGAAVAGA